MDALPSFLPVNDEQIGIQDAKGFIGDFNWLLQYTTFFWERLCFTERHSLVLDLKLARECEYSPSIDSGPGIAYQILSFLFSMYVCVCTFTSTCVPGACGCLRNSEEGVGSPGTA